MTSLTGSISATSPGGRFLSIVPPIFSALVYLSPTRTVHGFHKFKTTGEFPVMPYICMLLGGSMWTLYGFFKDDYTLVSANSIGVVCGLIYTFVFHQYSPLTIRKRLWFYYACVALFYVAVGIICSMKDIRVQVLATLSLVIQFTFLMSPFVTIARVFRTKSVDSLPFDMSFVQFWCSTIWTMYAWWVAADKIVITSSAAGMIISFLQLCCHMRYGCFTQSTKELLFGCCLAPTIQDIVQDEKHLDTISDTSSVSAGTTPILVEDLENGNNKTVVEGNSEPQQVILM